MPPGTFALTPQTRVTLSMVAVAASFAYWLVGLAHRVEAVETKQVEEIELRREIIARLDTQSNQLTSVAIDVAGIDARLALLVEWNEIRKRRNDPPRK